MRSLEVKDTEGRSRKGLNDNYQNLATMNRAACLQAALFMVGKVEVYRDFSG